MRITSKGRYGLKAVLELSSSFEGGSLLKTREIAERHAIPQKYLEQIINTLKRNKLVVSVRGAEGGYRLARPPHEITVYQVLEALEGDLSITEKTDGWDAEQGRFWRELESQVQTLLSVPLTDFLAAGRSGPKGLMYYI